MDYKRISDTEERQPLTGVTPKDSNRLVKLAVIVLIGLVTFLVMVHLGFQEEDSVFEESLGDVETTTAYTYGYIGCYGDDGSSRDLPYLASATVENESECAALCFNANYLYFGMQYKMECWCGNSYGSHGPSTGCACNSDTNKGSMVNCVHGIVSDTCYFREVSASECPCTDSDDSGCDLPECTWDTIGFCEADQTLPDGNTNYNVDNCPNYYDVFEKDCSVVLYGTEYHTGNTKSYDTIFSLSGSTVTFSVKALNDAHVGFFTDSEDLQSVYECVISGWGNTQSVIRRARAGKNQVTVATSGYLSGEEYRYFWCDAVNGLVRCGTGNDIGSKIFMQWQDPSPLEVSKLGLMTGWGSTGDWKIYAALDEARLAGEAYIGEGGDWLTTHLGHISVLVLGTSCVLGLRYVLGKQATAAQKPLLLEQEV